MMDQQTELLRRAVSKHLPGRSVRSVKDRGVWERHIFEVTLDNGDVVFIKMNLDPDWAAQEAVVAAFFQEHGLPAPRVLAEDASGDILPRPFLIQERIGGKRLGDLLDQVDEDDALSIYETLGRFYRRMHAMQHHRSGVWNGSPHEILDVSPNDYMYRAEILEGSGQRAWEQGRITQLTHDRVVDLWAKNIDYLKDHQPSLIHFSPFFWTIYLDRDGDGWRVAKLMGLGDVLWWDPACNLAFLRYPPFGEISTSRWEAFLRGYGAEPEQKRLLLYFVMQRLCAAMGTYKEPQNARNRAWAAQCLDDLDSVLDEIELQG